MAEEAFPLHFLVWNNQYLELDRELQKKEVSRGLWSSWWLMAFSGRTALRLCCLWFLGGFAAGCRAPGSEGAHPAGAGCVSGPPGVHPGAAEAHSRPHTLKRTRMEQWVLRWGAQFVFEGKRGAHCHVTWMHFSVLQEAVSTGDPELVQLVLQYRDFKRATERLAGIPELLSKLRQVKLLHIVTFGSKLKASRPWILLLPRATHLILHQASYLEQIFVLRLLSRVSHLWLFFLFIIFIRELFPTNMCASHKPDWIRIHRHKVAWLFSLSN